MTLSKNICLCCLSQKCKAAYSGTKMELQPCQEAFKFRQKVCSTSQWQLTNQEGTDWFKHVSLHWAARQTYSTIQPHPNAMPACVALQQHVADSRSRKRPPWAPLCIRTKLDSVFLACGTKTRTNILVVAPDVSKSSQKELLFLPNPGALFQEMNLRYCPDLACPGIMKIVPCCGQSLRHSGHSPSRSSHAVHSQPLAFQSLL